MRVCLLVPDLRPSGGIGVVLGHAERLQASGEFEIEVVSSRPARERRQRAGPRVTPLGDALDRSYDVAVATWWETVSDLLRIDAKARVALVQSAEERFYHPEEVLERLGAALALCAPVHFFTVARWLERLLAELRPDASTWYVPNGIDKSLFAPERRRASEGPLRILIEGQHSLWFKGVDQALAAVAQMKEERTVTLLSLDPTGAPEVEGVRVVGGLDRAGVCEEYAKHDVLVKLSRVESLGLPVVEAGHMGIPSVVTPYTGHDEVVRHGRNGIVVGFDDPHGVAHTLDRLASDREMLRSLSEGAVETMREWPSEADATEAFADALRAVSGAEPPEPGPAAFRRWRAAAEIARVHGGESAQERRELKGSVAWLEDALDETRRTAVEVTVSRDEAGELIAARDAELAERDRELAELRHAFEQNRAVRLSRAAKRAVGRLRR